MRHCPALVLSLLLVPALSAQPLIEPKDGRLTVPMTVSLADYPRPASRVYLLPEFRESIPGNRVQMFLRCFMEQDNFFGRAESERRQAWHAMPLSELPLDEIRHYGGRLVKRDMYDAARMTNADWQLWYFARRDGWRTLLPDVQKMRAIAQVLKTRVRGEIAAGDFDEALRTFKTFFSLARTLEAHPSLIGQLVGIAIAQIGAQALEEFIQQPGAPNLFWALTDLPTPFISLRTAMEGERAFISVDFDELRTSPDPVGDATLRRKIEDYDELFKTEGGALRDRKPDTTWMQSLQKRIKDAAEVKAARERLVKAGLKADHVRIWTPLHVLMLDDVIEYETHRDEIGKWFNLPYWIAAPGAKAAEDKIPVNREDVTLIMLVPNGQKVKMAQAQLDQRLAALRIIEALRLYAHGNNGKLPATLADTKLPMPIDPVSGQPFEYSLKDGVATLHGVNPMPGTDRTNIYYEVRVRK